MIRNLKLNTMLNLSHKNLEVYKISLKLIKEVYAITKGFPKEELYVLVSQIRRAAISVCSNIAEGASRISRAEKKRFYEISRSSLVEMDTQFEISSILDILFSKFGDELHNLVFDIISKTFHTPAERRAIKTMYG